MNTKLNDRMITETKKYLRFVEDNKSYLESEENIYSSFLEICKVLDSSIIVIERKIDRLNQKEIENKESTVKIYNNLTNTII